MHAGSKVLQKGTLSWWSGKARKPDDLFHGYLEFV